VKKHQREREEIKEEEQTEEDNFDIDEDEFNDEINSIKDADHILHLYDEDEFAFVDDEGNEVKDEDEDDEDEEDKSMNEALSRMERIRRKVRFARTKGKRERRRSIVLKRRSTMPVINRRARKHAILMLKKRIARKPLNKLSVQEKERLERMVQQRKKLVDRLAVRMAPKIRKIESDRLTHQRFTKEEVELDEGMKQTLRKYVPGYAKRQIDQKMDAGKFGRTDADKDANFYRYKKIQDKLKKEEIEEFISDEEFEQILQMENVTVERASEEETAQFDTLLEAEYQGREVPLGKPMAGDVKKSKVYVKDPDTGNVIKVNFGDKNMTIKKSNPERRKSFRARHNCADAKDRTTPRYWSCKAW
jgi:hypothetical protein